MGRPRTPTAILETRGAFIKNPQRRRTKEPGSSGPLGNPPRRLNGLEVTAWNEIVETAHPGTVGKNERLAVELFARLLARLWSGEIARHEHAALITMFGKFGMTPADRSKVSAKPEQEVSPLDEFAIN